jgi:hypothetical protein
MVKTAGVVTLGYPSSFMAMLMTVDGSNWRVSISPASMSAPCSKTLRWSSPIA